jgi:hypothetical protein
MFTRDDILSGERFQQLCDVYCGEPYHLFRNPKIAAEPHKHVDLNHLIAPWENPRLVFCYSNSLPVFMEKLKYFRNPFVLVSHNEDLNVTDQFLPIANHPLIVRWFAQNMNIDHPKVEMLPIGVANEMWEHGNLATLTGCIEMAPNIPKQCPVYFNFRLHTNPAQRKLCRDTLVKKGLQWNSDLPHGVYLMTLGSRKFSVSPPGNGLDCHRLWESLYLGTIPILLKSQFAETIQKSFPCIVLDSWDDFSEEKCLEQYDVLIAKYGQMYYEKLKFGYYKQKIETAVTPAASFDSDIAKSPMHVVYAFIGPLPSYSIDTVHQLRLFYDGPVYFIINDLANPMADILKNQYGVTIVPYESVKDDAFNALVNRVYHKFCIVPSLKGREKLFIYAFERFYLLHGLMKKEGLKNIFFAELDNLIYDDPRKWLDGFTLNEMSYMFDNYNRGASGVCFVRSTEILESFLNHCSTFIEFSTGFIDEMTALYKFWEKNKARIGMLPVHWDSDSVPPVASEHYDKYNGSIFDAASLGIFIGGMDPHHTGGIIKKGLRGKWSLIDYTHYTYKWDVDTAGRNIPYIQHPNGSWLRINNLHIHSKDLNPCMSDASPPATI